MNVVSRSHRILRKLKSYQNIEAEGSILALLPPLDSDESWIGVYRNRPDSFDDLVAFSSKRLFVNENDGWASVKYKDILDSQISQDKHEASEILVRTSDFNLLVPISGGDCKVREAFEVLRFLDRVKEDASRTIDSDKRSD